MNKLLKKILSVVLASSLFFCSVIFVSANSIIDPDKISCLRICSGIYVYYNYNANGQINSLIVTDSNHYFSYSEACSNSKMKMTFQYQQDKLIEACMYKKNLENWEITNLTQHSYTEDNLYKGQKRYIFENKQCYIIDEQTYSYNSDGTVNVFTKSNYTKEGRYSTNTVYYSYDGAGNLISEICYKGNTKKYAKLYYYDVYGRLSKIKTNDKVIDFLYDEYEVLFDFTEYSIGTAAFTKTEYFETANKNGDSVKTINTRSDAEASEHYITVYGYERSTDLIAGHLDFSINNEMTISYGTYGSGFFSKLFNRAQGYIFEADTSHWTSVEPFTKYETTIIVLSEEEMQALVISFLALLLAVTVEEEDPSAETIRHRVTQGEYAIYNLFNANCVTFLFDLLYPIIPSRIDAASMQVFGHNFESLDINMPDEGFELLCAIE